FKENKPSAPWLLLGLFLKTFFYFSFLFFKALLVLDKLEERRSLPCRAICPASCIRIHIAHTVLNVSLTDK
ncbi:MAG: hypothetical protein WBZ20_09405, partial [Nitrososphaeraceae archaeon]